ncbi:MAG: hypothetical protein GY718_19620 [Lentisphaerae bacterium]|nr:hypothetical protein [Lentisphaerota bacterium]
MKLCKGFSIWWRNPGHWDIGDKEKRIFCIRGKPGKYYVRDERLASEGLKSGITFNTVGLCMTYICDELMFELIVAKGQKVTEIEEWN